MTAATGRSGGDQQLLFDPDAERYLLAALFRCTAVEAEPVLDDFPDEAVGDGAHRYALLGIRSAVSQGLPPDETVVATELASLGLTSVFDQGRPILTLLQWSSALPVVAGQATHYRRRVLRVYERRRLWSVGARLQQSAEHNSDESLAEAAQLAVAHLTAPVSGHVVDPPLDLREFLDTDEPETDWVIPGLLERGERGILTAPGGAGKSTLLRQIAVCAAAGIHPFIFEDIDPQTVLLLDFENSARHLRRKLGALHAKAADTYERGRLRVVTRAEGIDLTQTGDVEWLHGVVNAVQPGLIVAGPLYKMGSGEPGEETPARRLTAHIDRIRSRHRAAVLLEAHQPYATGVKRRPLRPYGPSLYGRWPDFGPAIVETNDPTVYELAQWRPPREDDREWPRALRRGGEWPWTPADPIAKPRPNIGRVLRVLSRVYAEDPQRWLTARETAELVQADPIGGDFSDRTVRRAVGDLQRELGDGLDCRAGAGHEPLVFRLTRPVES